MLESREHVGIEAFTVLRAEDEPWLMKCFVPPPHFERVLSSRSVLVLGEPGVGKSAICRALEFYSNMDGKPTRLLVPWRPNLLETHDAPSIGWVKEQTQRLLDACAGAMLRLLATFPHYYTDAPEWVKARWVWFVHTYTLGDPKIRWGAMTSRTYPGGDLVRHVLTLPPPQVLYSNAPLHQVISEVASTLTHWQIEQLWVVVDGLEGWNNVAPELLANGLQALISTLGLFEHPFLAFKMSLPATMEPLIVQAGGIARRRVDVVRLRWSPSDLKRLVERRLALVFGRPEFRLEDLCAAPEFLAYLEHGGGASPREWLDQTAILVEYALDHPKEIPISRDTWLDLRARHPPHFYMDEKRQEVIVGGRRISLDQVPTRAYEMLRYLYRRAGQVVSRDEIYYHVYEGLDYVPRPGDDRYKGPAEYRGQIDTLLWHLRREIEPDPRRPVLLLTRRGKGVVLNVRV